MPAPISAYFSFVKQIALFLSLFLVSLSHLLAQDLNGIWKGTLTQSAGGCFPVYYIELQVNITGDSVNGASYHYSDISNYVKKKYKGSYNSALLKLSLAEGSIQTFKIPADCTPCIKNYELWYSRSGNKEVLSGEWSGRILSSGVACQPGQIVLSRVKESAFKEIPEVEVDSGTLRLDFYDNAEVDGDSITVLVNNKVVLTHQRLDTKPITTYLKIDLKNTFQEVEMVAENLGTIPPNTAMLLVTSHGKRYRLFLTSTKEKSAKVRFIYDPALSGKPTAP